MLRMSVFLVVQIQTAKRDAEGAKTDAKMAYDQALEARNKSEIARSDLESLLNQISDFISVKRASPDDIEAVSIKYCVLH